MDNKEFKNVTRLEVIGPNGREVISYGVKNLNFSVQDNGKTLKVFYDVDDDLANNVHQDILQGLIRSIDNNSPSNENSSSTSL